MTLLDQYLRGLSKQAQRDQSQSGWTRRRRRHGRRSNLRYVDRVHGKGWRDTIRGAIRTFMALEWQKSPKAPVIPVKDRPWVPYNRPSTFTAPPKPPVRGLMSATLWRNANVKLKRDCWIGWDGMWHIEDVRLVKRGGEWMVA